MRDLSPFLIGLVVLFLLQHPFSSTSWGVAKDDLEGEVTRLQGKAWLQRGGEGDEVPLALGDALHAGDMVRNGEASEVQIRMADGTDVKLRSGSILRMNDRHFTESGSSSVAVFLGRLWCQVASLAKGRSFRVETPTLVAGVRGTVYEVASFEDGASLVGVEEGRVEVEAAGKQAALAAGQAVEAEYEAQPQPLRPYDGSPRFWEEWREMRLRMVPKVLPPFTEKLEQRITQGLQLSRSLNQEAVQRSTGLRHLMEEAARLKAERKFQKLRELRGRIVSERVRLQGALRRVEQVDNRLAAARPMVERTHALAQRFKELLEPNYGLVMDRLRSIQQQATATREVRRENRRVLFENRRRILELESMMKEM